MSERLHHLRSELQIHLPYTIFSVTLGMVVLGLLTFVATLLKVEDMSIPSQQLFHIFHPVHMLFSATATTTMFWRHDKKIIKASIIGFIGAVAICGISDSIIPYISGTLLGVKMNLHICIFEHPMLILPFVAMGIFAGFIVPSEIKSTIFSHSVHVLVSSMASILYLVSFGLRDWILVSGLVLIYMILAVMIPCCTSDIIFPLLLTEKIEEGIHT